MAGYFLPMVFCCLSLTRFAFGDDDNGPNVVSYDTETFANGLKENRNFVMFYAPWCGHCKNLAPTWNELANIYNKAEGSPVVIGKVDCTVHTALCADHEIVGFPTLKMFDRGGENHKRYTGKRDLESLRTFIDEHLNREDIQAFDSSKQQAVPEPHTGLIVLTEENFKDRVQKGSFFIKFYAPWCGHCQRLAPTWDNLANVFRHDDKVNIAKVDCTQSVAVCKENGIGGYPTLLWFTNGVKTDQYQGQRSLDDLKRYVSDRTLADTNEPPAQVDSETDHASDSQKDTGADGIAQKPEVPQPKTSIILTGDNFKDSVKKGLFFVHFAAQWSGHCRHLAPTWDGLADIFNRDGQVTIAKIDCADYIDICNEYKISAHPTLLWLTDGVETDKYQGERTHEELKKYISNRLLTEIIEPPGVYEEEAQEASQDSASEVAVEDLTDDTFKSQIMSGLHFVKFFAPWCGHCKRLAPTWDDLGRKFQRHLVSIAKVDCTQHKATCENNQVRGYPTLKLFRDGEFVKDYKGSRSLEDLYEFVKQNIQGDHDEL